jgi:hypothetical protein
MTHQDNTPSTPMQRQIRPVNLNPAGGPDPDQGGVVYPPIPDSRTVPMRNAFSWIADALGLFRQRPWLWTRFMLAYAMLSICAMLSAKILHPLVLMLMGCAKALLIAGAVYSCDFLRREVSYTFKDCYDAFCHDSYRLPAVILIQVGYFIVMFTIIAVFTDKNMVSTVYKIMSFNTLLSANITTNMVFIGVIICIIIIINIMAFWFAPVLVMLHNISTLKAITISFSACIKNILPLGTIFFLIITTGLVIDFIIDYIIGYIGINTTIISKFFNFIFDLFINTMLLCFINYISYRDIFFDKVDQSKRTVPGY